MPPVYTPCLFARVLLWGLPSKFQWRMSQVPGELLAKRLVGLVHKIEMIWTLLIFIAVGQAVRITLFDSVTGISPYGPADMQAIWILLGITAAAIGVYVLSCWAFGFTPPLSASSKVKNACGVFSHAQKKNSRRLSYDLLEAWVGQEDSARLAQKVIHEETVQIQGVGTPARRL